MELAEKWHLGRGTSVGKGWKAATSSVSGIEKNLAGSSGWAFVLCALSAEQWRVLERGGTESEGPERAIYVPMSSACWKPFELNSLLWDMGKLSAPLTSSTRD